MHTASNKICINPLIEIAFKVSKNKLFPNACIIVNALFGLNIIAGDLFL